MSTTRLYRVPITVTVAVANGTSPETVRELIDGQLLIDQFAPSPDGHVRVVELHPEAWEYSEMRGTVYVVASHADHAVAVALDQVSYVGRIAPLERIEQIVVHEEEVRRVG